MALAGLAVAAEVGLVVPTDLSLLAWNDSTLRPLSNSAPSSMTLDVHGTGIQSADALLSTLAGRPVKSYPAPQPRLSVRGSTGTAPTRSPSSMR